MFFSTYWKKHTERNKKKQKESKGNKNGQITEQQGNEKK